MFRKGSILVALLLPLSALAACGGDDDQNSDSGSVSTAVVKVALTGAWGKPIDGGQSVSGGSAFILATAMYDRLAYFDLKTKQIVPYVAKSWTQTPTSVTFALRDDVTCADGTKVTPTVVKDSLTRLLDPTTGSLFVSQDFGVGPFTMDADDSAGTFTFTSQVPNAGLLFGFTSPTTGIICPAGLQPGADFSKQSYGSGPYVFKSQVQDNDYQVTKRKGWNWGPNGWASDDKGFPDGIDFKVVQNTNTMSNLLLTKGLDVAMVQGADVTRLQSDSSLSEYNVTAGTPRLLMINSQPGRVGEDKIVRQAIVTAIDPKQYASAIGEPDAPISSNITTNPGYECYSDLSSEMPTPSPDAAKQLLLDDGYTEGSDGTLEKDGKPLAIDIAGRDEYQPGVEYLADALSKAGFTIKSQNAATYDNFVNIFRSADFDVLVAEVSGAPGTPPVGATYVSFFSGPPTAEKGSNLSGQDDPQEDALLAAARQQVGDAACPAWQAFNKYVLDNYIAWPWTGGIYHWFSPKGQFSFDSFGEVFDPLSLRRTS
jgi:peptide/nickel transport system substrate-binding protein